MGLANGLVGPKFEKLLEAELYQKSTGDVGERKADGRGGGCEGFHFGGNRFAVKGDLRADDEVIKAFKCCFRVHPLVQGLFAWPFPHQGFFVLEYALGIFCWTFILVLGKGKVIAQYIVFEVLLYFGVGEGVGGYKKCKTKGGR